MFSVKALNRTEQYCNGYSRQLVREDCEPELSIFKLGEKREEFSSKRVLLLDYTKKLDFFVNRIGASQGFIRR